MKEALKKNKKKGTATKTISVYIFQNLSQPVSVWTKYSRMNQVKFVEDSLFKGCLHKFYLGHS